LFTKLDYENFNTYILHIISTRTKETDIPRVLPFAVIKRCYLFKFRRKNNLGISFVGGSCLSSSGLLALSQQKVGEETTKTLPALHSLQFLNNGKECKNISMQ